MTSSELKQIAGRLAATVIVAQSRNAVMRSLIEEARGNR